MQPDTLTKFTPGLGAKRAQIHSRVLLVIAAPTPTSERGEQPEDRRLRRHIRYVATPTATSASGERAWRARGSHGHYQVSVASTPTSERNEQPGKRRLRRQTRSIVKPTKASKRDEDVHPSHRAFIDPSRTPESDRVGVDTYLANAARKGSDRQLYAPVHDLDGNEVLLRPRDLLRKTVAIAQEFRKAGDDDYIPAMQRGKEELVKKSEVDYVIPQFEQVFSPLANLIPFKSAAQGNRVAMGSRMLTQAMALTGGEAPLVQSGIPGQPDRSFYQEFGKDAGAVFADQPGTVLEATDGHVLVQYENGERKKMGRFPLGMKVERRTVRSMDHGL